jgi:hypothetical protein
MMVIKTGILKSKVLFRIHVNAGDAVAELVEALRCKTEGRVLNSGWYHWNFPFT